MSCEARKGALDQTREAIEATFGDAEREARLLIGDARKEKAEGLKNLEDRERLEELVARIKFNTLADSAVTPLVESLHAEVSNRVVRDLQIELRRLADVAKLIVGQGGASPRVILALMQCHMKERPGITRRLCAEELWVGDFAPHARKAVSAITAAVKHNNIAALREAFEKFDAILWGMRDSGAPTESILELWNARCSVNPEELPNLLAARKKVADGPPVLRFNSH